MRIYNKKKEKQTNENWTPHNNNGRRYTFDD